MWKNLSHPNVSNIIGAPNNGMFAVISKWMDNGNIMALVVYNRMTRCRCSPGIFQIVDAVDGLKYLQRANIVHGDLKGVGLSAII